MQGLVTVFGGSGFVGRYAVRALAKAGWRVRVAVRRPHLAPELKVMGDVGQIEIVQANVRNAASVEQALQGADAVVNLVGVLYQHGPQSFKALQAQAPGLIAERAAALGVKRFVQMSAIGAKPKGGAAYSRTKSAGEAAARKAIPDTVVLRPSVVFGPEDQFFNRFAAMASVSGTIPLVGGGKAKLQPVYAGDVGAAIVAALDPARAGQTFELGGPKTYSFRELMELVVRETGRKTNLVSIPTLIARLIAVAGDLMTLTPVPPPLTSDQVTLLKRDNVCDPAVPGLAALGIAPTAVEAVVPHYLWRFRDGGQFARIAKRAA
jgi:uncharacterized protein YbjT (DUF2867 family)